VVVVALEAKKVTVTEDMAGKRVDLVVRNLCGWSREQVNGLFDHDCVILQGTVCHTPGQRVAVNDAVELRYDPHRRYHEKHKLRPHQAGFGIAFEDDYVIVVNKPPALLTVPTPYGEKNTLIHKVSQYLSRSGRNREAFVAHRLDRGVSGLLIFGKSLEISKKLRDQFELRKPQREYVALVSGLLASHEGTFRSYLATDGNLTRFSTSDTETGQLAITHFRSVSAFDNATLVQIWLETGRRNQIRVHFAEAGHPVLGDPRYQSRLAKHERWKYRRIALHARSLGFQHPVSGEMYRLESELPREFKDFVQGKDSRPHRRK
jgi:23S rRNA pseudouridine1911/1915/1917 synthase